LNLLKTPFHGNFGPALMTPRAFYRDQFDGQTEQFLPSSGLDFV
jgi:hypothetical protein